MVEKTFVKKSVADVLSARCENCLFFERDGVGGAAQSECRINPPMAVPVPGPSGQAAVLAYWPTTRSDRWCGKWEPRATPNQSN